MFKYQVIITMNHTLIMIKITPPDIRFHCPDTQFHCPDIRFHWTDIRLAICRSDIRLDHYPVKPYWPDIQLVVGQISVTIWRK